MAAQLLGRADGNSNFSTQSFVVGSAVTINKGDFVYFASGVITNASVATQKLLGMALDTQTGNAGGTIKALICVDPTMRYLIDNDNVGTTFGATHPGTYFDLTGATTAQLVDTSTTSTTGSLLCLEYNPQVDPVRTDTSWGTFLIAEHYFYPAQ
jgi:hypothetical protein